MAGIFHFVTTLSVQEFAQAVRLALPTGQGVESTGALLLLDSPAFDLRRRGCFLTLTTEADETSLSLRRLNHQATLAVAASARVPDAVRDIANQTMREQLNEWIGDTRLIVVQRWWAHGLRLACRNDDGKVECTLVAHQYRALAPDSPPSPLLVELQPKRGYEHETAAVARALAQQLVWSVQEHDAFEVLEECYLAAAAAQCAAAPPLQQATAPTALASWLLDHHTTMDAQLTPGAAPQAEQLHQLRVAMRHSRSLMRAYRDVLGRDTERHFQREFRWLSTATSRLRDLDVLLAALPTPIADYAGLTMRERQRLLSFLQHERARDAQRLQRVLDGKRYRRLHLTWPLALAMVLNQAPADAPSIATLAAAAIGRALARLRRDIIAIETHYCPSGVHELRKQCKRLRYLVAPCASLYSAEQVAWLQGGLKQLQYVLGESCDRYAQLALLEGHLWRRAKSRGAAVRAALRSARLALRQRLAVSEVGVVLGALHEFEEGRYPATLEALLKKPDL